MDVAVLHCSCNFFCAVLPPLFVFLSLQSFQGCMLACSSVLWPSQRLPPSVCVDVSGISMLTSSLIL